MANIWTNEVALQTLYGPIRKGQPLLHDGDDSKLLLFCTTEAKL